MGQGAVCLALEEVGVMESDLKVLIDAVEESSDSIKLNLSAGDFFASKKDGLILFNKGNSCNLKAIGRITNPVSKVL